LKEKFKILLDRAKNLRQSDDAEVDDIISKTNMYLGQAFPLESGPHKIELLGISFTSPYSTLLKNDGSTWKKGQQQLINFLDTRIEELEMNESNQKKKDVQPVIKEVFIEKEIEVEIPFEDTSKIDKLNVELSILKKEKNLWQKINWGTVITIGLVIISGAFFLGLYFGNNKFDQKKIDLTDENNKLKDSINVINVELEKSQEELNTLKGKIVLKKN